MASAEHITMTTAVRPRTGAMLARDLATPHGTEVSPSTGNRSSRAEQLLILDLATPLSRQQNRPKPSSWLPCGSGLHEVLQPTILPSTPTVMNRSGLQERRSRGR